MPSRQLQGHCQGEHQGQPDASGARCGTCAGAASEWGPHAASLGGVWGGPWGPRSSGGPRTRACTSALGPAGLQPQPCRRSQLTAVIPSLSQACWAEACWAEAGSLGGRLPAWEGYPDPMGWFPGQGQPGDGGSIKDPAEALVCMPSILQGGQGPQTTTPGSGLNTSSWGHGSWAPEKTWSMEIPASCLGILGPP